MNRRTLWFVGPLILAAALPIGGAPGPAYVTERPLEEPHSEMAAMVGAEWPELRFSSGLAHAASALADGLATGTPSSHRVREALHRFGVPESNALAATVWTSEDGLTDVLDRLSIILAGPKPFTHVGIGRAPSRRTEFRWTWMIILVDRTIELLRPVPGTAHPHTAFPLHFDLRSSHERPRVLVQYPGGQARRMMPAIRADGWYTVIPTGSETGTLVVQILAEDHTGPQVAAVMPVSLRGHEGSTLPHHPPAPEPAARTDNPDEAARLMAELINAARARNGFAPLIWDDRLADLAADHSRDMLVNGFLGHRSPSHGDLRDRLRTASIDAQVLRENLAMDLDIPSAHRALMESPGHRLNILARDVTHMGVGVVRQERDGGPPVWLVTEVFIRPAASAPADQP